MAAAVDKAYLEIREGIVGGPLCAGRPSDGPGIGDGHGPQSHAGAEAMRRLHAEGLIKIIPHRGAFVRHLDQQEILQDLRSRHHPGDLCAEAAARNATPAQLTELEGLCNSMEEQLAIAKQEEADAPSDHEDCGGQ